MRNGQTWVRVVVMVGILAASAAGLEAVRAAGPPPASTGGSTAAERLSAQEEQLRITLAPTAAVVVRSEKSLELWYPVRLAFNPLVSTIGWYLPALFSGSLIVATVMNLPNIGPLLLRALINQDMYLAGGILLIYSFLTIVGTLLSDVLLALIDPRIRVEI